MAKFDCPPIHIAMVRQFHGGMQARVQNDGEYSEPFPVTNRVKHGCVIVHGPGGVAMHPLSILWEWYNIVQQTPLINNQDVNT